MINIIELETSLNQEIELTKKIYLDTNFWCNIYDEIRDKGESEAFKKALDAKRQKKAIFPISYNLIFEVSNQKDIDKRNGTLALMSELSDDILIKTTKELMEIEVFKFLNSIFPNKFNVPNKFTKIGIAFTNQALESAIIEDLGNEVVKFSPIAKWHANLKMLAFSIKDLSFDNSECAEIAAILNEKNNNHSNEIRSLGKAKDIELRGSAYLYGKLASNAINEPIGNISTDDSLRVWENLFYEVLHQEKDTGILKIGRIYSAIHAFFRNDKNRELKGNDLGDFEHSALALSSFDAFFTDKSNRHTIIKSFGVKNQLEVSIGANINDLIQFLDSL